MSSSIDQIKAPIDEELKIFQKKFKASIKSSVPLLDKITAYMVKKKGKQMRPMFVLLSAKLFGEITEEVYRSASLVELLHTATLVHDDIVDDAMKRRGLFSINALWKNKVAVLVGDFILSKGMLLALENEDFKQLKIVSRAVKEMSEGELLQIEKTRNLNLDESVYFEIIKGKTASLIASCCANGTAANVENKDLIDKMWSFGEDLGVAFQIKDDLLDFGDDDIGKPKGIDIKENKMTLPIIYMINSADSSLKRKYINIIKRHNTDTDKVNWLIDEVHQSGGIQYAKDKMQEYKLSALTTLETMPEGEAKIALKALVEYTIDRKK